MSWGCGDCGIARRRFKVLLLREMPINARLPYSLLFTGLEIAIDTAAVNWAPRSRTDAKTFPARVVRKFIAFVDIQSSRNGYWHKFVLYAIIKWRRS